MLRAGLLPLMLVAIGCASGNCRQGMGTLSATTAAPPSTGSGATTSVSPGAGSPNASLPTANNATTAAPKSDATVLVYKADGTLQCAQGKEVSVADMQKQLGAIPVSKSEKRNDGLMHIQLCGSPTGNMNVYTIPANRLADAQKRGFKKWNF